MTHDRFSKFPTSQEAPHARPVVTRGLLLAGVAAAGAMGVGLGLWARPAMNERRMVIASPAFQAAAQKPRGQIQIVLDERPAPIGEPIEVLPREASAPVRMIEQAAEPELQAPVRPPEALMRVKVQAAPAPAEKPVLSAPPKPKAVQVATARPVPRQAEPKARTPEVKLAKVRPTAAKPDIRLAKAKPAQRRPTELAKAKGPQPSAKVVLARLAPRKAKAEAALRIDKVKYERPTKAQPQAKPVTRKPAVAKAPAKPSKVEKVATRKAKPAPRHEVAPAPPLRPTGLMKVSNRSRCGQVDPGAAIVCADPSLGAADRQMSRAYSNARAAGVSDDQLQRQQQRWLAARSAAAREAPWAVHDVYLARIAELNGMAREAHDGN